MVADSFESDFEEDFGDDGVEVEVFGEGVGRDRVDGE
jgi:hypothetical protein